MNTYYISDTGSGSGEGGKTPWSLPSRNSEPRNKQKKTETEQIRGPVNVEGKTRDLCNWMTEEKN